MKIWVTKDHLDGSTSKARLIDIDRFDTWGLLMMLQERDTASITLTKADLLTRLDRMESDESSV